PRPPKTRKPNTRRKAASKDGDSEGPITLDPEGNAKELARRGHDQVPVIVKAQSHQSAPGYHQLRLGVSRDLHDPAMSAPARRDVQVAVAIKGQTLRPSKPRKESGHFTLGAYPHHGVKARQRRSGSIKITAGSNRKMVRGHARLKSRERHRLADLVYTIDRAAAVADKQSPGRVECDPGSDPQVARKVLGLFERSHSVD